MYQHTFSTPFHSLKTQPSVCCIHLLDIIPIGDSLKCPPSLPHFSSKLESARLGVFPSIGKYDLWSQRVDCNTVSSDDASCFLLLTSPLDVYIV